MQWVVGRLLALPLRVIAVFVALYMLALRVAQRIGHGLNKFAGEIARLRNEARQVSADIASFSAQQCASNPLDPGKKTVFLTI
ncbi:MAG TPA: hypothetical protein VGN85_03460, partial [Methyloceanibacter sp.]|nr:hypothetical protein [Methyloceanibacter sp.]